jgi:hypothetical protein
MTALTRAAAATGSFFRRAEPRSRFGLAAALDFQRADDFR